MEIRRSLGWRSVTSSPPIRMRPEVGISSPAIILRLVVLPQPEGPSRQTNSPSPISNLRSLAAVTAPKVLVTSRNSTDAMRQPLMPPKNRKPNLQLTKR